MQDKIITQIAIDAQKYPLKNLVKNKKIATLAKKRDTQLRLG